MSKLFRFWLALLALLALGCAEERAPIDRTQPNGIKKAYFAGEWYYQRTVIDVPASSGFTFVGNSGEMEKIKFDLQESYLYVRRTTEFIKNADDKKAKGNKYSGEVVGAFRVVSHFDVRHAYNSTTGEEMNVLEENAFDRPWFEREYVRIDWSNNLVHNMDMDFERASIEGVPYYPQDTAADGSKNPDAPHFETDGSYFDITSRMFARAGTTYYEGYGEIPLCWLLGNEFVECGPGEYGIRHSFKKLDPKHQYIPKPYKGAETDMFGFFWSERLGYDSKDGIKFSYKERYLSRHNIWQNWTDSAGKPIPEKDRQVRPIVYHVNGEFPDDLKATARKVAGQWNKVFKEVVQVTGNPYKGDMFILCENNPVKAGDPVQCGKAGDAPRLGDIRYSFMAYVPKYMTYGLLGLGPSNKDPDTGEILSGMAYLYHHNNVAAFRTQEMVELLNGTRDPTKFISGTDMTDWVDQFKKGQARFQPSTLEDAAKMVERLTEREEAKYWQDRQVPITEADEKAQQAKGFDTWVQPHLDALYNAGIRNGQAIQSDAVLKQFEGTPLEKMLMSPELKMAAGLPPNAQVDEKMLNEASPLRKNFAKFLGDRSKLREQYAAEHDCMYLADMADDAMMGLAKDLKDKKPEEVYAIIKDSLYTAVFAHEVGHSLGLMHNFGGSDDVVNYFDDYWKLRTADGTVKPRLLDPMTDAERDGKIYNYGYSSIMDYAGRYTIDGGGVGKYDRAAMLFGYANKVEVFLDAGNKANEGIWKDWFDGRGEILKFWAFGPEIWHYTRVYGLLKDKLWQADNRMLVDASTLTSDLSKAKTEEGDKVRVPYIYCSHGRSDLSDSCLTRDFGADSYERMKNYLDEWDTWYITRAFTRGSVGVNNWSYASRWYGRLYQKIKQWHDMYGLYAALLPQFYSPAIMKKFFTDPSSGWGGETWAVQNGFNYLMQTILMPDIGNYAQVTQPDGTKLYKVGQGSVSLGVDQARYYSTNWSFSGQGGKECGYFWTECLDHIGYYVDKVMAIEALSDSQTNFVARANPIDIREWQVGYYNTFSESIRKVHAALQSGDWSRVGPYLDKGKLKWPNYAGALTDVHENAVDPAADFTVQLYFALLGNARFINTFDRHFADESTMWILGTGKGPQVAPEKMVTFTDPDTGLTYAALDLADEVGGADGNTMLPNSAGEAMIRHANLLLARSTACDLADATTATVDDCFLPKPDAAALGDLRKYVQLLRAVVDMTATIHYNDPLNP